MVLFQLEHIKEFQYSRYKERPWVSHVLEGCNDKVQAFENWMERDALFSEDIKRGALHLGYETITVDENASIEENLLLVERLFGL